ncbi:hypothetical protein ACFZB2_37115 [Streptomyces bobili]|uniref:hypothetical protein n=1 Tax=Streptomyces bobili TaxID=67280 RepID=UPI0036EC06EC
MYSTAAALALDVDLVRAVVADRTAWKAASLPRDEAAARIGWHWRDIYRRGAEGRITRGRGGRHLIADLDTMAAEADGEQYRVMRCARRAGPRVGLRNGVPQCLSWTAKPSLVAPVLFRNQPTSSPDRVKWSTTPSRPRSRPSRQPLPPPP